MLKQIDEHARRGRSFAFETTLSGRGHARRISSRPPTPRCTGTRAASSPGPSTQAPKAVAATRRERPTSLPRFGIPPIPTEPGRVYSASIPALLILSSHGRGSRRSVSAQRPAGCIPWPTAARLRRPSRRRTSSSWEKPSVEPFSSETPTPSRCSGRRLSPPRGLKSTPTPRHCTGYRPCDSSVSASRPTVALDPRTLLSYSRLDP